MKIITPIRARSRNELLTLVEKVQGRADILEIWLDQIHWMDSYTKDIKDKEPRVQLLGVCKTINEGGTFQKDTSKKVQILQNFLESGGDWVDLDIHQNELKTVKNIPAEKLWLSIHDFEKVPENLEELYKMMKFFNPYGFKFAMTPRTPQELKTFIDFAMSDLFQGQMQRSTGFSWSQSYSMIPKPNAIFTTMGEKYGHLGRQEIKLKECTWGGFYAVSKDQTTAVGQSTLEDLHS